jgi:hypothetical protein
MWLLFIMVILCEHLNKVLNIIKLEMQASPLGAFFFIRQQILMDWIIVHKALGEIS